MGLEVFDHMMDHHPLLSIMVGALTEEGAGFTLHAFAGGAVDCIEFELLFGIWAVR